MRVLVTGGAGYIGSHAVRALQARGHQPIVIDDLSSGHRGAVPDGVLLVGNLLDRRSVAAAFDAGPVEALMHFAAHWDVGESVRNPRKYFHDNLLGAINLLEEALERRIPYFVLSSTCAVYGEPRTVPIGEDHPTSPVNPYGETKLVIEKMLEAYDGAYGLRSTSLRYFNAAGADPAGGIGEKHDPETHLIPRILEAATEPGRTITIHGTDYPTRDGTCIRDFVHVMDIAEAHLLALERMVRLGSSGTYNLGTGTGHSVLEVIEAARKVTGSALPSISGPRRAGDPPALVALAEKARAELGWKPRYSSLETILRTAWEWQRARDRALM